LTSVYPVYGRRLASEVPLPEIAPCAGPPDWRFRIGSLEDGDLAWFEIWPTEHDTPWVRARRTPAGYGIRYVGRADFVIDRAARSIVCQPRDSPDSMLRHFLLDQVLPLTFSLDALVLHGSSVAVDGRFAAFIGPGGAGKSTLALALGRSGHGIGADDGLLVEPAPAPSAPPLPSIPSHLATPSYPSLRVWEDSAALADRAAMNEDAPLLAKRRYRDGYTFVTCPLPLAAIYILDRVPAPSIRFEPIAPRAATIALVEQSYRLALDDRTMLARQLDQLASLARQVPVWRLSSPRRLDAWEELSCAVADHIGNCARFEVA